MRIKTLEEKIPSSYDQLRRRIEQLAVNSRNKEISPIIKKSDFWSVYTASQSVIIAPASVFSH